MSILDLNGNNLSLPDGTVFTTSYLTGSNDVTNNGDVTYSNPTITTAVVGNTSGYGVIGTGDFNGGGTTADGRCR